MPATFAILFLVLMAVGVPIALALSLAPIVGFMLADKWTFLNIGPIIPPSIMMVIHALVRPSSR